MNNLSSFEKLLVDDDQDIMSTYTSGVNCYIKKPVGLKEFQSVIRTVDKIWFTMVQLNI